MKDIKINFRRCTLHLKVKGKPLYYWARKGVYLSREERKINVSEVTLIEHNKKEAKLRIACSKGTYIRGLVEDLGRRIKCYATVKSLRRLKDWTSSFRFTFLQFT